MQFNSKRPSQERTSVNYNHVRNPLNPIVNNNSDYSRYIENNLDDRKSSKYLQTQLTLFQEKIATLEVELSQYKEKTEFQQKEIGNYQFELEQVYVNTQEKFFKQEISKEEIIYKDNMISQLTSQVETLQEKIAGMQNSYQQERLQMKQLLLNKELDNKLLYSELSKLSHSVNTKPAQDEKHQLKIISTEYQEYKVCKMKEIEKLQEQLNNYQAKLKQIDLIKIEELQSKLDITIKEFDLQLQKQQALNSQIAQHQFQLNQLNNNCTNLKEEKQQLIKEKSAIETYYLDQLQKQDAQLNQMIKGSQQSEHKILNQKLVCQLEQKDKIIEELRSQKCNCSAVKLKMKDLEQNNMTLILEVERLNNILKQKLLELESQDKDNTIHKLKQQYSEETEIWKSRYSLVNRQNHTNQELIMVLQTELEHMRKKQF